VRPEPCRADGEERLAADAQGMEAGEGRAVLRRLQAQRVHRPSNHRSSGGAGDGTWAELREALRSTWVESTRCANWLMTQLYARDQHPDASRSQLGRMPHIYLYPEARTLFPRLSAQSVAALAQRTLALYKTHRYDVLWTGMRSLPVFRYPVGFATPRQAWSLHEEHGRWFVALRIDGRRWLLRLRGGAQMRRHIARLAQIASGAAEPGDATIYEIPVSSSDHRSGFPGRPATRVMLKIAAWLPKPAARRDGITLRLRTDRHAVLLAEGSDWRIDAAPMRAVLATDERRQRELSPARERTLQLSRARRERLLQTRNDRLRRSRQRIADACRTYAAHAAAYAARRRVSVVEYSDTDRGALPHFPWEQLRRHLAAKLEERGIRFVYMDAPRELTTTAAQEVGSSGVR
jgi:hypothetical protein